MQERRRRQAAADGLNAGTRIAILAGQGALGARDEFTRLADTFAAPVAKALLCKAVLPDDSRFTTDGNWRSGNGALVVGDEVVRHGADRRLNNAVGGILSHAWPGVRCSVEPTGLASAIRSRSYSPVTSTRRCRPSCRCCSAKAIAASSRSSEPHSGLECVAGKGGSYRSLALRPQMVIRALSNLLADDAVISLDCGANTHFAARCVRLRANQRFTGTGMLATMAPGVSFAIAAQLAYPNGNRSRSSATSQC